MLGLLSVLCTMGAFANAAEETWEVLGIHDEKQLIAYKKTYREQDEEGNPAMDCGHPDVPPGQGVQLGLWSVSEGKTIQQWEIYRSLIDYHAGKNKKGCMTFAQATEALTKAKESYSLLGIDITTKPSGIAPNSNGVFAIPDKAGKSHNFSLVIFEDLPIPGEEGGGGYLLKRWIRNAQSEVVYSLELTGVKIMASTLSVYFPAAYRIGDQVVFLEKTESFSMRHNKTTFRFTPPIEIK